MNKFILTLITVTSSLPLYSSANLEKIQSGNERFINGDIEFIDHSFEDRKQLAKSQTPFATILTCSDSRVPPELIFDQNPGELFVVRVAGNVVDQLGLASIEYGVAVLKIPLLMIMGHQNCGAVQSAFDLGETEFSANIATLLSQIKPSTRKAKQLYPNKSGAELLHLATIENVYHTHREIINRSPIVREYLQSGKLEIVDAIFNIETGKVTILDAIPTKPQESVFRKEKVPAVKRSQVTQY